MKIARSALAGILALFAAGSAIAQQFPVVPDHTVVGRVGVGGSSGPAQAIPFANFVAQMLTANGVPNSALAQMPAATVKCNPLAITANAQDCTIQGLVARGAPDANNDKLLLFDNAAGTLKYVTPGLIASAATSGVSSLNGNIGALTGAYLNTRSAYTGANSLQTTDCFKTVALGGSAFYTFTINAASGYNAACHSVIVNEDNVCPTNGASTCRGKNIAINGYASFILWPGQMFRLVNQNNIWQFNQPGRWSPLVGMTWHINHASGNNNNDGLATGAGAFATIQRCIDVMEGLIDFGQANIGPTCKNDAETFTENNAIHTHPLTGYHVISVTGDTTTPSNVVWQVSGTGNTAYQGRDTGMGIITGFKFVSTGTGNNFIQAGQLAVADFGSIEFGSNSSGYDIQLTPGGSANYFGGTLSITGDMAGWILGTGEGHVLMDGATVSIPNARTFTNFLQLGPLTMVSATGMTFTGAGAGAGSTGRKYSVSLNSVLSLSGTVLPGATAGVTATGGQVVP